MAFVITFRGFPWLVLHHDVSCVGSLHAVRWVAGGGIATEDEEVYWLDAELCSAISRGWGSWYVDVCYANRSYGVYIVEEVACAQSLTVAGAFLGGVERFGNYQYGL
jgi:hypothetical protein